MTGGGIRRRGKGGNRTSRKGKMEGEERRRREVNFKDGG